MIGNILLWISILVLLLRSVKSKKRESILLTTQKGLFCYHCKSIINIDREYIINRLTNDKKELRLCTSCERDQSINRLFSKINFDYKKYCYNWVGITTQIVLAISACLLLILSSVLHFKYGLNGDIYTTLGGFLSLCSNIIMYIIFIVTSEPKKK